MRGVRSEIFGAFVILTAAVLILSALPCVATAAVFGTEKTTDYVCDFETSYYGYGKNNTAGKIEKNDGNTFLSVTVSDKASGHYFEIYNADAGVLKIESNAVYSVGIRYKVKYAPNGCDNLFFNICRYNGQNNELAKIKSVQASFPQTGHEDEWFYSTVTFKQDISSSPELDRLAIEAQYSGEKELRAENPIEILFDDITVFSAFGCNAAELYSNGGTVCDTVLAPAGAEITLPTPERRLYDFLGWYTDPGLTAKFKGSKMPKDFITKLYAKWQPSADAICVSFDAGKDISVPVLVGLEGEPLVLPDVEREGFCFAGWFDKSLKSRQALTEFPKESVKLYAKYYAVGKRFDFENSDKYPAPKSSTRSGRYEFSTTAFSGKYSLKYDLNLDYGTNWSAYARAMLYDEQGERLTLIPGQKYRVTFKYKIVRWDQGNKKTGKFGIVLSSSDSTWTNWKVQTFDGTPHQPNEEMMGKGWQTFSETFTAESVSRNDVFVSIGCIGDVGMCIDDIVIYTEDAKSPYVGDLVRFDSGCAEAFDVVVGKIGESFTLPVPKEREGYRFLGWCYDRDCLNEVTEPVINSGYTVLYADWYELIERGKEQDEEQETETEPQVRENTGQNEEKTDRAPNIYLIIGVAAGLIVVAAAVVIVILIKKKRKVT